MDRESFLGADPAVAMPRTQAWLSPLDAAPLECDGLSRCIAMLLRREQIPHQVVFGKLAIAGVGRLDTLHCWVSMGRGVIIDYRARMWLRNDPRSPHGVFIPAKHEHYSVHGFESVPIVTPVLFEILTGLPFDTYPYLLSAAQVDQAKAGLR